MKFTTAILSLAAVWGSLSGLARADTPIVQLETTLGDMVLQLDADRAPLTVANFMSYVGSGFYDGTLFHRVIPNFVIQGGGFDENLQQKATSAPIRNEADNGLQNLRGTIAMARTSDPHSATSQFFINQADNSFLDFTSQTSTGWGYAVFGQVIEGEDVMDSIADVPTGSNDSPLTNVVIERASVVVEDSTPTYSANSQMLRLPVVASGGVNYEVAMQYLGGASFLLTEAGELSARFPFEDVTFEPESGRLDIERVVVSEDGTVYTVEMQYRGGNLFELTVLELADSETD